MKLSQKLSNYSFLILFVILIIGTFIFGSCESCSNRSVKIEQGNNNDSNEIKVNMSEAGSQNVDIKQNDNNDHNKIEVTTD